MLLSTCISQPTQSLLIRVCCKLLFIWHNILLTPVQLKPICNHLHTDITFTIVSLIDLEPYVNVFRHVVFRVQTWLLMCFHVIYFTVILEALSRNGSSTGNGTAHHRKSSENNNANHNERAGQGATGAECAKSYTKEQLEGVQRWRTTTHISPISLFNHTWIHFFDIYF